MSSPDTANNNTMSLDKLKMLIKPELSINGIVNIIGFIGVCMTVWFTMKADVQALGSNVALLDQKTTAADKQMELRISIAEGQIHELRGLNAKALENQNLVAQTLAGIKALLSKKVD